MKNFRRITAIVIVISILLSAAAPAFAFSKNESRSIESFFIESKLLRGDGSSYGLGNTPTRLEGVIILIRLLGKEAEAQRLQQLPCRFSDVPSWATGYANYAYEENISKGVSDTLFGTNDPMTAQQFNTLLLRTIGYDDSLGDFRWDRAVNKAYELAILPGDLADRYETKASYTKRDLMETAFCYLEAEFKDGDETLILSLIDDSVISKELANDYGLAVDSWRRITTNAGGNDVITFELSGNSLYITGETTSDSKKYVLAMVKNKKTGAKKEETVKAVAPDGEYSLTLSVGSLGKGEYYIDLYENDERYNTYTSFVHSSIVLKVTENDKFFATSPVYGQNLRIYKGNATEEQDLVMTLRTRSDSRSVKTVSELAAAITEGTSSDYDKVRAIHDWVASNIYYDRDFLENKTKKTNIDSIDVLENQYAVCSGYSNLTKDLLAASGIPSKQVVGFALGITTEGGWENVDLETIAPNHIWNEALVDGRWIIVDSTWDSNNKYEGGKFTKGESFSRLYFDASVQFLSNTHMSTDLSMR